MDGLKDDDNLELRDTDQEDDSASLHTHSEAAVDNTEEAKEVKEEAAVVTHEAKNKAEEEAVDANAEAKEEAEEEAGEEAEEEAVEQEEKESRSKVVRKRVMLPSEPENSYLAGRVEMEPIVKKLTKLIGRREGLEALKQLFAMADTDSNGTLDVREFTDLIGQLDVNNTISEEEVHSVFDLFDADGNGELDFAEFQQVQKAELEWKDMEEVFAFDEKRIEDGKADEKTLEEYAAHKKKLMGSFQKGVRVNRSDSVMGDLTRQGDIDMLSLSSLQYRENLKDDDRIKNTANTWWNSIQTKEEDDEGEEFITKDSYVTLSMAVQKELMPDTFSKTEAERIAGEDWVADSKGYNLMDYDSFYDAMFDLCYTWTDGIDPAAHCRLLVTMQDVHIKVEASGLMMAAAEAAAAAAIPAAMLAVQVAAEATAALDAFMVKVRAASSAAAAAACVAASLAAPLASATCVFVDLTAVALAEIAAAEKLVKQIRKREAKKRAVREAAKTSVWAAFVAERFVEEAEEAIEEAKRRIAEASRNAAAAAIHACADAEAAIVVAENEIQEAILRIQKAMREAAAIATYATAWVEERMEEMDKEIAKALTKVACRNAALAAVTAVAYAEHAIAQAEKALAKRVIAIAAKAATHAAAHAARFAERADALLVELCKVASADAAKHSIAAAAFIGDAVERVLGVVAEAIAEAEARAKAKHLAETIARAAAVGLAGAERAMFVAFADRQAACNKAALMARTAADATKQISKNMTALMAQFADELKAIFAAQKAKRLLEEYVAFWEKFDIERLHVGINNVCVRCSLSRLLHKYALPTASLDIPFGDDFKLLRDCQCLELASGRLCRGNYFRKLKEYASKKARDIAVQAFTTKRSNFVVIFLEQWDELHLSHGNTIGSDAICTPVVGSFAGQQDLLHEQARQQRLAQRYLMAPRTRTLPKTRRAHRHHQHRHHRFLSGVPEQQQQQQQQSSRSPRSPDLPSEAPTMRGSSSSSSSSSSSTTMRQRLPHVPGGMVAGGITASRMSREAPSTPSSSSSSRGSGTPMPPLALNHTLLRSNRAGNRPNSSRPMTRQERFDMLMPTAATTTSLQQDLAQSGSKKRKKRKNEGRSGHEHRKANNPMDILAPSLRSALPPLKNFPPSPTTA